METLVAGIVLVGAGALVATYGVRVFYLLLPLWGFLTGFALGAQLMTQLFGEAFLATIAGWGVGLVAGIVLAVIAGAWYWASIVILAGGLGWVLGTGLLELMGLADGLLPLVAGAAAAAVLAIVAIAVNAPTLLVALLTSLGGTAYAVAGVLLVLGRIARADLENGPVASLAGMPLAIVAWLALAAVSLVAQLAAARGQSPDIMAPINRT